MLPEHLSTLVPAGQADPPAPPSGPATLDGVNSAIAALNADVRTWRAASFVLGVTALYFGIGSWRHSRAAAKHAAEASKHRASLAGIRRLAE